MNDEIVIRDIDVYKKNPNILQDIAYVRANLGSLYEIGLKFDNYPVNLKNHILFITEYFSTIATNKKEYKHIPKTLLNDQFFISACLRQNPDIYLLADNSCHTEFAFKALCKYHPSQYLKYAKESDLNNIDFCKEALKVSYTNFQYMPEKFKENSDLIMNTLSPNNLDRKNISRAESVVRHIPAHILEDKKFVDAMLDKNPYAFNFLPQKYKKDEYFAYKIVCKDSKFFKELDESLKNNEEFVNKVLIHGKITKRGFSYNSAFERAENIDILIELDNKFFTRDLCEEYSEDIKKIYTSMNKKIRANLEVIRANFLNNPSRDKQYELYKMSFLSKIPNEDLVQEIRAFTTSTSGNELYEIGPSRIVKLIENFELKKALEKELSSNEQATKKMKL